MIPSPMGIQFTQALCFALFVVLYGLNLLYQLGKTFLNPGVYPAAAVLVLFIVISGLYLAVSLIIKHATGLM